MSEYFQVNYKITRNDGWPIENNIQVFCDSESDAFDFIDQEGGYHEKQLLEQWGLTDSGAIFEWKNVVPVCEVEKYEEAL